MRPRPHAPQRPLWLCRACAAPWPCGQAKIELLRELATDGTYLRIYLASQMHEALADLCALTPYEMPSPVQVWNRFLSWAAPPAMASVAARLSWRVARRSI
nr:hypothetical protein [Micromonospora sp. DSM 115978]